MARDDSSACVPSAVTSPSTFRRSERIQNTLGAACIQTTIFSIVIGDVKLFLFAVRRLEIESVPWKTAPMCRVFAHMLFPSTGTARRLAALDAALLQLGVNDV